MAEVRVAKSAGFCYGVERAVKLAEETAREKGGCAMLGSIIHNVHVVAELEALDGEYAALAENAARRTVLVGDRFPFRYLMDDYGLEYYAAFSGCSAETEASFETIAFLSGKTEELALPCILTTESPQPGVAETIRSNTASGDQTILQLDSMQSAGTGDNYLDIMKENLEVLRQALA